MNCWTNYTGVLFLEVKAYVEPATFLGLADNGRMVHHCAADSPEQHSSGFEFRVFPFLRLVDLPNLESPIYPTIYTIDRDWMPYHLLAQMAGAVGYANCIPAER